MKSITKSSALASSQEVLTLSEIISMYNMPKKIYNIYYSSRSGYGDLIEWLGVALI